MKKLSIQFFLILSLSIFSNEKTELQKRIDNLVECSALYTYLSLGGPIMLLKTKLLYGASDFWVEAGMTISEKYNFEMSKEYSNSIGENHRKLIDSFESFYDDGSFFRIQKNVASEDLQKEFQTIYEYNEKRGINDKTVECDALAQTFKYSWVIKENENKVRD